MIHDLYTLSALANSIYESSSQRSGLGQIDLSATQEQDADLQLLFQSLFYLCQMTLHSNIVPAFSALPSNPQISSDIVRTSAEAVVNHATAFTDILHEYLQRPDMSKVAPLVGYTAFISGLVFILKSRINPASHDEVERRTADCRFLLDTLCFYWQPLRRVVSVLPPLFLAFLYLGLIGILFANLAKDLAPCDEFSRISQGSWKQCNCFDNCTRICLSPRIPTHAVQTIFRTL